MERGTRSQPTDELLVDGREVEKCPEIDYQAGASAVGTLGPRTQPKQPASHS
jgi:hypothetical protein